MEKTNRILYLDRLRVFSIFLVMLLHVAAAFWGYVPVDGRKFAVLSIYNGIAHVCVPCLVMVTGALLLEGRADETPGRILKTRCLPVACALVFWTLAYGLIRTGIRFAAGAKAEALITYFWDCLRQPMHFWYLYMLLGLYLILPILRLIAANRERERYLILLSFTVSCLLPVVLELSGFQQQGGLRLEYLGFAAGYSGYCLLGHYLSKADWDQKVYSLLVGIGLVCLLAIPLGTILLSRGRGAYAGFFDYFSPLIWLGSCAMFLLFRRYGNTPAKKEWHRAMEQRLNESSFGMYLVHMFFNEALILLGLTAQGLPALWAVPVLSAAVFVGSYLTVRILRKIPLFRGKLL